MRTIKEIRIKCGHCQTIFPSPLFFADELSWTTAKTAGNRVQCPTAGCRQIINCNQDNMSVWFTDGSGEMGWDYPGNKL